VNEKEAARELISVIKISARPEKRQELFLTISSLLDSIRGEDGCRGYRFYGEAGEQDSFLLVGEWNTRFDWYRHLNSERFAVLRGSIQLLSVEKDLIFDLWSRVEGIELFSTRGSTTKEHSQHGSAERERFRE